MVSTEELDQRPMLHLSLIRASRGFFCCWLGWGASHNAVKGNAALRCNTSLVQHQAKAGSLYPPFTHSRISKLLLDGGSCNCNWIVEHCRTAKDQSCIISHSFAHLMTTPRSYCCYYWGVFTQCHEVESTVMHSLCLLCEAGWGVSTPECSCGFCEVCTPSQCCC